MNDRTVAFASSLALASCVALAAALAVAVSGCAPKESKDEPFIYRAEAGPKLHLTAPMYNALQAWNPEFEPYRLRDFALRVRRGVSSAYGLSSETDKQALFTALGDFDGNGDRDAALLGHAGTRAYLVAVLARGTEAKVDVLESWEPDPKERRAGLELFLSHVPAGARMTGLGQMRTKPTADGKGTTSVPDTSLFLGRPAFNLGRDRISEIVYYHDGGIWKSFAVRH